MPKNHPSSSGQYTLNLRPTNASGESFAATAILKHGDINVEMAGKKRCKASSALFLLTLETAVAQTKLHGTLPSDCKYLAEQRLWVQLVFQYSDELLSGLCNLPAWGLCQL